MKSAFGGNIKKLAIGVAATGIFLVSALPTFAAAPAVPGCFGADRAAYIHDVAQVDPSAPGASEVGHILAARAGSNGAINQAYKTSCGGNPTPQPIIFGVLRIGNPKQPIGETLRFDSG